MVSWFRKVISAVVLLGLAVVLPGCLQIETVVRVETDGSGTITENFMMSGEVIGMLASMAPEGEKFNILDQPQLEADAAKYGEGVSLVSAEPRESDFGQGYTAVYAFSDINAVRLNQDPGAKIPDNQAQPAEGEEPSFITFAMQGSDPSELVVNWPVEEPDPSADAAGTQTASETGPQEEPDAQAMEMMKGFFKDMRMAMHVEVGGTIVETNAAHQDGSKVILLDMAFGELIADEAALKTMMMEEPKTVAEMKEMAASLPGLKMEFEPVVSIKFE